MVIPLEPSHPPKWISLLRLVQRHSIIVVTRETTEGWPLLTVETEVMGTQEVQWKGILPWLVRWARRAVTRDFCPALVVVHYFSSLVPIAQQAVHLPLNVCWLLTPQ